MRVNPFRRRNKIQSFRCLYRESFISEMKCKTTAFVSPEMKSRVFTLHFADEASAIEAKTPNLKEFTHVYILFEQCLYTRDLVVVIFRMVLLSVN